MGGIFFFFFFFKQKTAYEMRISDWSSDVCSSDLLGRGAGEGDRQAPCDRGVAWHRGRAMADRADIGGGLWRRDLLSRRSLSRRRRQARRKQDRKSVV